MAHNTPRVPPPTAHYPGQSHAAMNQQVRENNNPGAAGEIAAEWKSIADELTEVAVGLNTVVNGLSGGWSGTAGTAARQALTKVGNFTDKMSETFTSTGNSIQTQTDAAEKAQNSFPKEVPYDPKKMFIDAQTNWNPIDNFTLPFDMMEQREKSQQAKQEAERVMTERDNSMATAAAQMPTFEDTPQVTHEQGTTQTSSTTYSKNTNSVNPNQQFGQPNMQGVNNTGTTNTSWTAPPTTPPVMPPPNTTLPPGTKPPGMPPLTPPPGLFPPGGKPNPNDPRNNPRGGPNGRGGGPAGRGGGPGGGGPGGRGAGGFGPGGAGGRGAGSFGPASPGGSSGVMNNAHGPEGTAGRGGAAGGAAGRAGAAGAGGMGGGAGAGQGAEDKEHKSTYLQPTDEYFDDDRMVAPPVIGG
ncbi:WXG100 family type VII secretion target [Lentzea tibetensis]|uniref:WXG100 family type VII secretion target n=2 Tax=Lentzea tibetensis TaxID=2591470 RepID=A0A563F0W6_9PSEU|nr:WXG100 family type VII secretion target [Lentzea tibetensis]